jgi:hypothetical protein
MTQRRESALVHPIGQCANFEPMGAGGTAFTAAVLDTAFTDLMPPLLFRLLVAAVWWRSAGEYHDCTAGF